MGKTKGMRCPFCGYVEQKVLDSRSAKDGEAIRRRRECLNCERRFTTFESPETYSVYVIKRDQSRVPFEKEKLLKSMLVACHKRPVPIEYLQSATDKLEKEIFETHSIEVPSVEIGKKVLNILLNIDKVAYVRFASVYLDFNSLEHFIAIIDQVDSGLNTEKI